MIEMETPQPNNLTQTQTFQLTPRQIGARKAWETMRSPDWTPPNGKRKSDKVIKHKPEITLPKDMVKASSTISPQHKAWNTMDKKKAMESGLLTYPKRPSTYNRHGKNAFRDIVVNYMEDKIGSVLALESDEMLFVKALPKHSFIIHEHDVDIFNKIRNSNPGNVVSLSRSDIVEAKSLNYTYAFLDFCNTFSLNVTRLKSLAKILNTTEVIAFTFSKRNDPTNRGVTKKRAQVFDIIKRLQLMYPNHIFETAFEYSDRDIISKRGGMPMVGIIMRRRDIMEAVYGSS